MSDLEPGPLQFAEEGQTLDLYRAEAEALKIQNNKGELVVKIGFDGAIEFGEGYEPEEAAREFWDAVSKVIAGPDPWDAVYATLTERLLAAGHPVPQPGSIYGIDADTLPEGTYAKGEDVPLGTVIKTAEEHPAKGKVWVRLGER